MTTFSKVLFPTSAASGASMRPGLQAPGGWPIAGRDSISVEGEDSAIFIYRTQCLCQLIFLI
jgi:hypothetical protein